MASIRHDRQPGIRSDRLGQPFARRPELGVAFASDDEHRHRELVGSGPTRGSWVPVPASRRLEAARRRCSRRRSARHGRRRGESPAKSGCASHGSRKRLQPVVLEARRPVPHRRPAGPDRAAARPVRRCPQEDQRLDEGRLGRGRDADRGGRPSSSRGSSPRARLAEQAGAVPQIGTSPDVPWPGASTAMTRWSCARSAAITSHDLAVGVKPWTSTIGGPSPCWIVWSRGPCGHRR